MTAPWSLAVKPPPCCGVTVKKEREELCCHLLGALLDTSFGQSRLTWRCRLLKRGDGHRRFPAIATMECCCCRGGEPIICCFAGVECCLAGALEVPLVAVPPRRGRDIVKPWIIVVPPLLFATFVAVLPCHSCRKDGVCHCFEGSPLDRDGNYRGDHLIHSWSWEPPGKEPCCFEVFPTRCRS